MIRTGHINRLLRAGALILGINLPAMAAQDTGFDHFTTGFPLTGKHEFIDCSACHIAGQFKGTPIDCGQCHNNQIAPGKHPNHVPSNDFCDDCHTIDSWQHANYDHGSIVQPCQNCHNAHTAAGLPPLHINSSPNCEACHNTVTFSRVGRIDHGEVNGTCKSCHDGFTASGVHPAHIQTTAECDTCHNTSSWRSGIRFDHSDITRPCSSCHDGVTATGKSASHLVTSAECDTCHLSTSTWLGASFDHNNVTGLCSACHDGVTATGKTSTHFVTTLDCIDCHDTNRWVPMSTLFRHDSADYPGDHRSSVLCVDCHTTNNQTIAWPYSSYRPDCAGCHVGDYEPDKHKNTPIAELADCAGSCHFDGMKSGEHRTSSSEW